MAPADRQRSARLCLIAREEYPRRAFDHLRDPLRRRRGRCLENVRNEQRRLTHLHELRRRQLEVLDLEIARPRMNLKINSEPGDRQRYEGVIETPAEVRHP